MKRMIGFGRLSGVRWATLVIGILTLVFLDASSPDFLAQAESQVAFTPPASPDDANRIGPDGGEISTPDGRLRITVPPGALSEITPVLLAISPGYGDATSFEFDVALGPKSADLPLPTFASPVTVELTPTTEDLSRLGTNAAALSLKEFDYDTSNTIPTPSTADASKSSYSAQISEPGHFILSADTTLETPQKAEASVTPDTGGFLESPDSEVRLEFPPGAATEDLKVEFEPADLPKSAPFHVVGQFDVNAYAVNKGNALANEFSKPLTVTISPSPEELAAWNENSLTLYVLNEQSGQWDKVPNQSTTNGVITASIDHFSTYSYGASSNIAGPGSNLHHQVDMHAGSANIDIPVEVDPGPGGFQPPSLVLSYTSSSVNEMKSGYSMGGSLGIGWDLRLPAIIRDPGSGGPGNPQGRFFLQLDGITDELIRITTPPAPDGQWNYWATKNERYLRIASRVLGGVNALFTVDAQDGTTYFFGTKPNPGCCVGDTAFQRWYWQNIGGTWYQHFYRFDLSRVKDTHGNYADYTYTRDTYDPCDYCGKTAVRSAYLSTIDWGGNLSVSHPHRFRISTVLNNPDPPTLDRRADPPFCSGVPDPAAYETRFFKEIKVQVLRDPTLEPDITRKYKLSYYDVTTAQGGTLTGTGPSCSPTPRSGSLRLWALQQYGKSLHGTIGDGPQLNESSFSYVNHDMDFRYWHAVGAPPLSVNCDPSTSFSRPFLHQANNGFGGTTTFAYTDKWQQGGPYPNESSAVGPCTGTYAQGCPAPPVFPCGSMPTWNRIVVSQRTDSPATFAGASPDVTHTYTYGDGPKTWNNTNPMFSAPIDADYRGFRDATERDATNAEKKCWYFTTGWEPEIGMPADILTGKNFKCQSFNASGGPYLESTHPFWYWRAGAVAGSNFVYESTRDTYGLHAGCHCETWSYDTRGNVIQQTESGPGAYRSTITEYYPNTTLWIVGLPGSSTVSDSNGMLSREEFLYDGNALYTQQPNKGDRTATWRNISPTVKRQQDSTTYDDFGNPWQAIKWREGAAVLTTTRAYHGFYKNFLNSESRAIAGGATLAESYVYDTLLGVTTQITDANNQVSKYSYDDFGRLAGEWEPDEVSYFPNQPTVQHSYLWGSAPIRTITYRREATGSFGQLIEVSIHDGLGRLIQQRSEIDANICPGTSKMAVVDTEYDSVGHVESESIPYEAQSADCLSTSHSPPLPVGKTSYDYDGLGRTTKVTNPSGSFRQMSFGSGNGTTTTIDENLHKTENIEDAFGRVTDVKEYRGTGTVPDPYPATPYTHTKQRYDIVDGADRVATVTEGEGTVLPDPPNVTTTKYSMLGRTQTQDPDMGTWNYSYYDDGLLSTQTDARGVTQQNYYDGLNRVTSRTFSNYVGNGLSSPVTYTYDTCQVYCPNDFPKGHLTAVTDWAGVHSYNYDIRGRAHYENHQIPVGGTAYEIRHRYDSMDREDRTTYPDGQTLTRFFNSQGLVNQMISQTNLILNTATYNAAGLPTQLGLSSGSAFKVDSTYRAADLRVEGVTASTLTQTRLDLDYDYDPKGNIKTVTDHLEGSPPATTIATHNYDELDRLTSVTGIPNTSIEYEYSNIGNITRKVEGASNYPSLTYPAGGAARPHAVQTANPLTGGQHTFAYTDPNGHTTSESVAGTGLLHSYEYDAAGQTFKRTTASTETKYYYGEDETLYRKLAPGETTGTVYIGGIYEKNVDTGAVVKYYYLNGQRIAMRIGAGAGGTTYYMISDHLGGTALITTFQGVETARLRYFPFGGIRSQTGTPNTDKLFTGQQRETTDGTGIYHYGARLYNTDVARFPQADTFTSASGSQAISRYSYVQNNPTNFTDPTGHFVWEPLGGGGGGGGGTSPPAPAPAPPPYGGSPPPAPTPSPNPPAKYFSGGPVFIHADFQVLRQALAPSCPGHIYRPIVICEFWVSLYATVLNDRMHLRVSLTGRDAQAVRTWISAVGYAEYGWKRITRRLRPSGTNFAATLWGPTPQEVGFHFFYTSRVTVEVTGIRIDLRSGVYYPIPR